MSGCKSCGDCCREVVFPIAPASIDWAQLHGLDLVFEAGELHASAPIACRLFDPEAHRCSDYEHRPLTCKVYLCDEAKA